MSTEDNRDQEALKHFKTRSQSKPPGLGPKPVDLTPSQFNIHVDCGQFGGHVDTDRWIHVGTSPQVTQCDISQARRRLQTFMADS